MRKIKLTEEQLKYALREGVTITANVDAAGGDVKKAVDTAKDNAAKSGVDPKKTTIQIPPTESKIILKKGLREASLMRLKKNSEYYHLNEFLKRVGKKNVNESGLTNTQIRNITGITDDDELNAAAEAENAENLESEVWRSIAEIAGGNPRQNTFRFPEMTKMLNDKYGFRYNGPDEEDESHVFSDGKYELTIYPVTFYPKQGGMRIYNMHIV